MGSPLITTKGNNSNISNMNQLLGKLSPTSSGAYLIKTDQINLPTDVNPLWADAENADVFEASLGIHNASCHGSWQRWWHSDSDDVQGLDDDGLSWHLREERFTCLSASSVIITCQTVHQVGISHSKSDQISHNLISLISGEGR